MYGTNEGVKEGISILYKYKLGTKALQKKKNYKKNNNSDVRWGVV